MWKGEHTLCSVLKKLGNNRNQFHLNSKTRSPPPQKNDTKHKDLWQMNLKDETKMYDDKTAEDRLRTISCNDRLGFLSGVFKVGNLNTHHNSSVINVKYQYGDVMWVPQSYFNLIFTLGFVIVPSYFTFLWTLLVL